MMVDGESVFQQLKIIFDVTKSLKQELHHQLQAEIKKNYSMTPCYELKKIFLWWEHKLKSSNSEVVRVCLSK